MVDMQKEPAKAGSFFDRRGKMMGSRFRVVVTASPQYKIWRCPKVCDGRFPRIVSPPRRRCPVGADRTLAV